MIHLVSCSKCGSLLQYDNASINEGLRDFEEVICPVCGNVVGTVFTDLLPVAAVVKSEG